MAQLNSMSVVRIEDAEVEYSTDGSTWTELPNVGSFNIAVSERTTQSVTSLKTIRSWTSAPTEVGDVTINIAAYLPQLPVSGTMSTSWETGSQVQIRATTKEREIWDGTAAALSAVQAAIDTAGLVTFTGTGFDFSTRIAGRGDAIIIGTAGYIISSIDITGATTTVMVAPAPDNAVTADQYKIVNPSLRLQFAGEVKSFGAANAEREGAYSTDLTITPSTHIKPTDWRPVFS